MKPGARNQFLQADDIAVEIRPASFDFSVKDVSLFWPLPHWLPIIDIAWVFLPLLKQVVPSLVYCIQKTHYFHKTPC